MKTKIDQLLEQGSLVLLGKEQEILLALTCLVAKGHLLIEDLPGMGKTSLAKFLATSLGLDFGRIQFTNDLLPADILGFNAPDLKTHEIAFHPGPIFHSLILADEINRGSAKTQSALLEAMEEGKVTVEGKTHLLPRPFLVIATQNPKTHLGTQSLPESQLDRFLMKINLGFLKTPDELKLLKRPSVNENTPQVLFNRNDLLQMQELSQLVFVSDQLLSYVLRLLQYSRQHSSFAPLSTRAGLGFINALKAFAYLHQKEFVTPEDVKLLFPLVMGHRLSMHLNLDIRAEQDLARKLLQAVPVDL